MKNNFTTNRLSGRSFGITKVFVALAIALFTIPVANAQNYVIAACNEAYVQVQGQAGSTFIGQGDDATFNTLSLPFTFTFYSTAYTQFLVNTNGHLVFLTGTNRGLGNAALPTATAGAALYPFWDDLDISTVTTPNAGIYSRVDGVAPNRIFTVEWFGAGHFNDVANQTVTFQIRLFETSNRILFKYQDVVFGGTQTAFDNGLSATVGIEGPVATPRPFTQYSFNTASLTNGQCIEFVLPPPCTPVPGPTVLAGTDPGTCLATVTVPVPGSTPQGCLNGTGTGIRYRVGNVGPFIVVPLPYTTVTIAGLSSGTHTITWQIFTIANGATTGFATQQIIVSDNEDPILNCPADINLSLDPGACNAIINFEVTATDNCPFAGPMGQVNTINTGGNGNSSGGMVWFNIDNQSGEDITVTELGLNISNATNVNVYRKAGTHVGFETNAGAWTLVGTADANTGPFSGPFPGNGTITPAPVSFIVPPGLHGIALHTISASSNYTNGNGPNQTYTDGTITLLLGSTANTAWGAPFTPRVFNGYVAYGTSSNAGDVIQTSGLPSGSVFEVGTVTNCFIVTDNAGNTGTCCFDITVSEFPTPTTTLACNDNVQVSVNENCEAFVTTDMILEGGPYGC
ncbi:MAG TPA: HYR domain-containing protein, partial [Saprospiraceae bacterium]|nr:HYR domain-containing protein [Saprospiraceae bacterium]